MEVGSDRSNFERWLDVLRRRGLWIPLCCILAALAAYGYSKHQAKMYTATASLIFKSNQLDQQIAGLPTNIATQADQNTNVKLVQVGDMAAKTASRLGHGLTEQKVSKSLSIAQQGETSLGGESTIVDVSASAASATLAAEIANTYAEQFVAEQQKANHLYFTSALATVSKQLAALSPQQRLRAPGVDLQNRAQQLKLLSELQYGGVQLAQSAVTPSSPSSPKVSRNTVIGGVLGLLVGLGLVLLLERLDPRIREPEELETIYQAPLLGIVPGSSSRSRSAQLAVDASSVLPSAETEAFRLILAHLRSFNAKRDVRAVLVTSAAASDGTAAVSLHLAEAAAKSGSRTLLLEMNLRRPTLAHDLRIQSGPGLRDVLADAISVSDAIQSVDLPVLATNGTRTPSLDVLTSGAVLPPFNPDEMIKSDTMNALLDRLKSTYDLIIIDTPSLMEVSDAFPILRTVDGVIVVSRMGRDRRDVAERLRQILDRSAAPLLGVVANRLSANRRDSHASNDIKGSESESSSPVVSSNGTSSSDDEPRLTTRTS